MHRGRGFRTPMSGFSAACLLLETEKVAPPRGDVASGFIRFWR